MSKPCHFLTIDTSKKSTTTTNSNNNKANNVNDILCVGDLNSSFCRSIVVLLNGRYCAFGLHSSQHCIFFAFKRPNSTSLTIYKQFHLIVNSQLSIHTYLVRTDIVFEYIYWKPYVSGYIGIPTRTAK